MRGLGDELVLVDVGWLEVVGWLVGGTFLS